MANGICKTGQRIPKNFNAKQREVETKAHVRQKQDNDRDEICGAR